VAEPHAIRRLAGLLNSLQRDVRALQTAPRLGMSSIEGGSIDAYDEAGNLIGRVGQQHDGTNGAVALDGPPPPRATAPTTAVGPLALTVTWDGLVLDEEGLARPLPLDFEAVQVLARMGEDPMPADVVGVITSQAGGSKTLTMEKGTWHVALRTRATTGRMAEQLSDVAVAEVPGAVDEAWSEQMEADLAALDKALSDASAELHGLADDLDRRLTTAETGLTAAEGRLTTAEGQVAAAVRDAGDAVELASAAAGDVAGVPRIIHATRAPTTNDKAPQRSTWFQHRPVTGDATSLAGPVIAQYAQAADAVDGNVWVSSQLANDVLAGLDVGKLTAGSAEVVELVAKKIAAATAAFQRVDAGNLFVTETATIATAVAQAIYAAKIAAQRILASEVLIGGPVNLMPGGAGEYGAAAGVIPPSLTWDPTDVPPGSGLPGSFRTAAGEGTRGSTGVEWDVTPGAEYRFEMWLKADKPNSRLYVELRDQAGAHGAELSAIAGETFAGSSTYPVSNYVVPTTWTKVTALAKARPETNKLRLGSLYFNHPNGAERGATVSIAGLRMRPMTGAALIVDGDILTRHLASLAVTTEKLDALAVTAAKIAANAIVADKIAAGAVTAGKLEAALALLTRIIAGDPTGTHAEMNPSGFYVYKADPLGGPPLVVVRLGVAETNDYLAVTNAEGETLATVDEQGRGTFQDLNVPGTLTLAGDNLADILNQYPYGTIAKTTLNGDVVFSSTSGRLLTSNFTIPGTGPRQIRVRLTATIERLTSGGPLPVAFDLKRSVNGTVTSGNSTVKTFRTTTDSVSHNTYYIEWEFNSAELDAVSVGGAEMSIGIWARTSTGNNVRILSSNSGRSDSTGVETALVIEDLGPGIDTSRQTGTSTEQSGSSDGSGSSGQATRTQTWDASWNANYKAGGALHATNEGRAHQGYLASNPRRMSQVGFPAMASTLSGSRINWIEVYVYFAHWFYNAGGTAVIGVHRNASAPNTYSNQVDDVVRKALPKPGGAWVRLPSSVHAGFLSGSYRGITLRAPGDSTSAAYYGYATVAKIRVNYTK
jgi:hypothetical protein